jgi:transcriptional regulator with XRE-family HTH domain
MKRNDQMIIFHQGETATKNEFQPISTQKGQLLAKKIETAMKERCFNRQQFAGIMGVQPSIITRWLSGNHNFTVETLFEIEDQLGIQLIAIEKPVYKQMSFHMVVGSEPAQHLNSSLVEVLSGIIPSRVTYCIGSKTNFIDDSSENLNFMEFFKVHDK